MEANLFAGRSRLACCSRFLTTFVSQYVVDDLVKSVDNRSDINKRVVMKYYMSSGHTGVKFQESLCLESSN